MKVRALAEGLARRGHQVTVLTADWGLEKRVPNPSEKIAAERSPFGWRSRVNGVEAIYLPTWLHYRRASWNPAVKRYCRARLGKFDIIHIFGLYDLLGPPVAAACRKRVIPYVVEPIGMFLPIVRSLWLKRLYHLIWGGKMLQGASHVLATSEQEIEELVGGGVSRAKVLIRRNGVEVPESWPKGGTFREALGIARDAKLVLFLGRLSVKKSPDLLLRATAEVLRTSAGIPLKLVFAGPDEGVKTQLEQLASQLGVRANVQIAGPLFGEAKWAAYREADVFVLPSQNENFGNAAAEAVAAGTPVIVTEQCGIAPLLANEAGLVVPHEIGALAHALRQVLGNEELRGHLKAGCAKVALNLGWDGPIREMESLYSTCLAASKRGETRQLE